MARNQPPRKSVEFDAAEIGFLGLAFNPESAFTSTPAAVK